MFINNQKINIAELREFIETPSQEFKEDRDLKPAIDGIISILDRNPVAIMDIIKDSIKDSELRGTYLLDDLADKMKRLKCLENLQLLFNSCKDELLSTCVCNVYDLKRYTDAFPGCLGELMKHLFSKEDHVKLILNSDNKPKEALEKIKKDYKEYPDYVNQFTEHFNRSTRSPKP